MTLTPPIQRDVPDKLGRFGKYGGQFVPETLMAALGELETAYRAARQDQSFWEELSNLLTDYVGRPTPLYHATNLSRKLGGAQSAQTRRPRHTPAHTKSTTPWGKSSWPSASAKTHHRRNRAGQHGVATATACAMMGLECIVYMGEEDIHRQAPNVYRMKLLVHPSKPSSPVGRTLKDAINEAIRDWVTNVQTTHYLIGSAVGPHPYPMLVRDFQNVIGKEARAQSLKQIGRLPDYAVACVGGGSNAIGLFSGFVDDEAVGLIGVEAGGDGVDTDRHSATITKGRPGVLHGAMSYLLQDEWGQVSEAHSVSAGLDYPGVGPEHSYFHDIERAKYVAVDDEAALDGFDLLCLTEGIIPALEPSHAIAYIKEWAPTLDPSTIILMLLSGRGDKDLETVATRRGLEI